MTTSQQNSFQVPVEEQKFNSQTEDLKFSSAIVSRAIGSTPSFDSLTRRDFRKLRSPKQRSFHFGCTRDQYEFECRRRVEVICGRRFEWTKPMFYPDLPVHVRLDHSDYGDLVDGELFNPYLLQLVEPFTTAIQRYVYRQFDHVLSWISKHSLSAIDYVTRCICREVGISENMLELVQFVLYVFRDRVLALFDNWQIRIPEVQSGMCPCPDPFVSPLTHHKLFNVGSTIRIQISGYIARFNVTPFNPIMFEATVRKLVRTMDFGIMQYNQTLDHNGQCLQEFRMPKNIVTATTRFQVFFQKWQESLKLSANDCHTRDCATTIQFACAKFCIRIRDDHDLNAYDYCKRIRNVQDIDPLPRRSRILNGITDFEVWDAEPEVQAGEPEGGDEPIVEETVVQEENLVIVDQRQIEVEEVHISGDLDVSDDETGASTDASWRSTEKLCGRPWLVDNFMWQVGDPVGGLTGYIIPSQIMRSDGDAGKCAMPADTHSKYFNFCRTGIDFRIQVNTNKFQSGALIMYFRPFSTLSSAKDTNNNIFAYPHVVVDASTSNSGTLHVPFAHFYSQFTMRETINPENQYLGQLKIAIINTLRASEGSSKQARVSLYASLAKPKFTVMLPFSDSSGLSNLPTVLRPNKFMEVQSGVLGMLPELMNMVGGSEGLWKSAAKFGTSFAGGCDNPTMASPSMPIVPRIMDNTSFGNGLDISSRLSLDRKSYTKTTPAMASSKTSDMDLLAYSQLQTRLTTVQWNANDEPSKALVVIPVTPALCVKSILADSGFAVENTAASFVARAFMYWQGPMVFKFQVVTSQQHSGRLLYSVHYDAGSSIVPPELCSKLIRPSVVFDIQEKKVLEVEVPFNCTQPFLRCDQQVALDATGDGVRYGRPGDDVVAWITLSVLNELVAPNNVAPEVDINIFTAAGAGMKFFNPSPLGNIVHFGSTLGTMTELHRRDNPTEEEIKYEVQAGEVMKNTTKREGEKPVVPQKGPIAKPSKQMPESHTDMKFLLKRFYPCETSKLLPADSRTKLTAIYIPVRPLYASDPQNEVSVENTYYQQINHIGYFSQCFTFWRGTMRYKIIIPPEMSGMVANVVYKPNEYSKEKVETDCERTWMLRDLECGTVVYTGNVCGSLEFEVPFISKYNKLLTGIQYHDATEMAGIVVVYLDMVSNPPDANLGWYTILQSIGDDFEFMTIRAPPTVTWGACKTLVDTPEVSLKKVTNDGVFARELNDCGDESAGCPPGVTFQIDRVRSMWCWMTQEGILKDDSPRYIWWNCLYHGTTPIQQNNFNVWTDHKEDVMKVIGQDPGSSAASQNSCWKYIYSLPPVDPKCLPTTSHGVIRAFTRMMHSFYWFNVAIGSGHKGWSEPLAWVDFKNKSDMEDLNTDCLTFKMNDVMWEGKEAWDLLGASDDLDLKALWEMMRREPSWNELQMLEYVQNLYRKVISEGIVTYFGAHGWRNAYSVGPGYSPALFDLWNGVRCILKVPARDPEIIKRIDNWLDGVPVRVRKVYEQLEVQGVGDVTSNLDRMGAAAQTITGAAPQMLDACERMKVTSDKVNATIDTLNTQLQPVFQAVIGVNEKLTSISSKAGDFLDSFTASTGCNMLKLTAIAFNIQGLLTAWKWSSRIGHALSLASLLGLDGQVVYDAFVAFVNFLTGKLVAPLEVNKGEVQAGMIDGLLEGVTEHSDILKIIVGTICTGVFTMFMTKLPEKKNVLPFVEKLCEKARVVHLISQGAKGVKWFWEFIMNAIRESVDWVLGSEHPSFNAIKWLAQGSEDVVEWFRTIDNFEGDSVMISMVYDPDLVVEVDRSIDTGYEILKRLVATNKPSKLDALVRDGLRRLRKVRETIEKEQLNIPVRVDPFCVMVTGGPGVGKSAILGTLMNDLLDKMKYPKSNRVYTRNDVDTFWSNYRSQSAVLIDDFYSNTESPIVNEFIQVKSNVNYPLNMAELESKGRPFTSHFIFGTTNISWPKPTKITTVKALWRRRDMLIEMFRKGEEKRFNILSPTEQGQTLRADISYAELLDMLFERATGFLKNQRELVHRMIQQGSILVPECIREQLKLLPTDSLWQYNFVADCGVEAEVQTGDKEMMDRVFQELGDLRQRIEGTRASSVPLVSRKELVDLFSRIGKEVKSVPQTFHAIEQAGYFHGMPLEQVGDISPGLRQWLYKQDGNWHVKLEAPPHYFFEFEILANGGQMDAIDKYMKQSTLKKVQSVSEKYRTEIVEGAKKLSVQYREWCAEHPKVTMALKILGGAIAIFGVLKAGEYLCPELAKTLQGKIVKWLGLDVKKEPESRLRKWAKWVVPSEMQEHIDAGDFEDYLEEERESPVMKLYRKVRNKLGRNHPAAQALEEELQSGGAYGAYNRINSQQRQVIKSGVMTTQSADVNAMEIKNQRIYPNVVYVEGLNKLNNKRQCVRGVFIVEDYLMVPYHFLSKLPNGSEIAIHSVSDFYTTTWIEGSEKRLANKDVAIIKIGGTCRRYKQLWKYFVKEADLGVVTKTSGMLLRAGQPNEEGKVVHVEMLLNAEAIVEEQINDSAAGDKYLNQYGWRYSDAPTAPGDCGAVLLALCPRMPRKILGFHVAGYDGKGGFSVGITQEMILTAIDPSALEMIKKRDLAILEVESYLDPDEAPKIHFKGAFTQIGTVKKEFSVVLPKKSTLRPSMIHDDVAIHCKEPSVLSRGDPRNLSGVPPLEQAVIKYGTPRKEFDENIVHAAGMYVSSLIDTEHVDVMERRLLTEREVVLGNDNIEYLDRMNMSTSPGFPYRQTVGSIKGKGWMFDEITGDVRFLPLKLRYMDREEKARRGERVSSVWTDCLKDELRPLQKIEMGKTRLFTIPPVDYTMLFRKYFLAFIVCFYANYGVSFSAVGIDPYSFDWTLIHDRLSKYGNRVIGGDFKEFDGFMYPRFIMAWCEIVNKWYDDGSENALVRRTLCDEICYTVQLCLNVMYMTHQGNPSGNPATTVLNTMVHKMLMVSIYLELAYELSPGNMSLDSFDENVLDIYYGDDDLLAVSSAVSEWFNAENVTKAYREHGIVYTDESKTGSNLGFRQLSEVTFLKNGFVKHRDLPLFFAPIAKETILDLTNWIRVSDDDREMTRLNCASALGFAFHHGKGFYEQLRERINFFLRRERIREFADPYEIMLSAFESKCGFCVPLSGREN